MAIDPMLYEKYSGRSADPTQRIGEALAGASKRSSQIGSGVESDGGRSDGMFCGLKTQWWISIIGSIVVLVILLSVFVRW